MRTGVDKTTIFNWEAGTATPNLRALPAVIRFLGYAPRPSAKSQPDTFRQLRQGLGLSVEELAARIMVDPSRVQNWEQRATAPDPGCTPGS